MNNPAVKEIQVNSNGSLEVSFRPHCEESYNIMNKYGLSFDHYHRNNNRLAMVSESSGILALVYDTKGDEIHQDYEVIKITRTSDAYIEVEKKYMRDFWSLPNIQLPKKARLANQFGIGYYPNESAETYDMYFFSNDQKEVELHFGTEIASKYKEELHYYKLENGLYGVTYNRDMEVLNLKRYLYPSDPYCKNPSYI